MSIIYAKFIRFMHMIAYNSLQATILVSFHSTIAIDGEIKWKHYRDF